MTAMHCSRLIHARGKLEKLKALRFSGGIVGPYASCAKSENGLSLAS